MSRKAKRDIVSGRLTQEDAEAIHEIILQCGDHSFIRRYKRELIANAGMRKGMYAQDCAWRGTPLTDALIEILDKRFKIKKLQCTHLICESRDFIELRMLAGSLSEATVMTYFRFDPKKQAKKAGIDYEIFKTNLREAFRGTVGKHGTKEFGILLDKSIENNMNDYSTVVGLGILMHPPRSLEAVKDSKSVFLVTSEYSALAVEIISMILDLNESKQ